jgi:hypothetical protein
MRMAISILACCGLAALAMTLFHSSDARAADKKPRLLRHVVMYKYKDELTPAQLREVIDAFVALPAKIDTIVDFEHGENVSPEGKSDGLTHAFVVTFKDEQGRAIYLDHPAHLEYVKLAGPRREKVVVFDYWSSE